MSSMSLKRDERHCSAKTSSRRCLSCEHSYFCTWTEAISPLLLCFLQIALQQKGTVGGCNAVIKNGHFDFDICVATEMKAFAEINCIFCVIKLPNFKLKSGKYLSQAKVPNLLKGLMLGRVNQKCTFLDADCCQIMRPCFSSCTL